MTVVRVLGTSRRRMLGFMGAACVVATGISPAWKLNATPTSIAELVSIIAQKCARDRDITYLGKQYFVAHATRQERDQLAEWLAADLATTDALDPAASHELDSTLAALSQAVEADFSEGRTVLVDGWCLSQTEARFCALSYQSS